jgi:hypothetical protein
LQETKRKKQTWTRARKGIDSISTNATALAGRRKALVIFLIARQAIVARRTEKRKRER